MDVRDRLAAGWEREPRARALGLTAVVVGVCAVLSIGQVRYDDRASSAAAGAVPAPPTAPDPGSTTPLLPVATTPPTAGASGTPSTAPVAAPSSAVPASTAAPKTVLGPSGVAYPDLGLVTQGVTATTVTIGATYDKSGCGDSGTISQSLGTAVTGDPEKSYRAFTDYVNATGGIHGKTLKTVTEDDGGVQCTASNKASAVALIDTDKVFMVLPGLNEVSDYVATRHIPFLGGRPSKAEQAKQGLGQFQFYQDADGDFANWAAFGKNYLHSDSNAPCLVHPDTDDFNSLEPVLVQAMAAQGLAFKDIARYADDTSTAEQSAQTTSARFKTDGCKSVWLVANNALADVFFTNAAAQQQYFPQWTWTSRTNLIDAQLGGSLMNQQEWKNAVGLSIRVPAGKSPEEGNCAAIYRQYGSSSDGESGSAAVQLACAQVLLATEAMRRAVDRTGVLDANSLMQGVNAIQDNFYWDATVPLTYTIPTSISQPSDFTGFDVETIATWNGNDYDFPYFPTYWKQVGPGLSGGEDITPLFTKPYTP